MCRPKRRRYIERDGARPFGGLRFIKSFLPQQSDPFFRGALDRTPPNQRRTCGRLIIIVRGIRLFGNVRTAVWKAEPKTVEENRATYTSATRSVHSRQMSRIVAGSAGGNRCRSWNVFEGGVGGSGARARGNEITNVVLGARGTPEEEFHAVVLPYPPVPDSRSILRSPSTRRSLTLSHPSPCRTIEHGSATIFPRSTACPSPSRGRDVLYHTGRRRKCEAYAAAAAAAAGPCEPRGGTRRTIEHVTGNKKKNTAAVTVIPPGRFEIIPRKRRRSFPEHSLTPGLRKYRVSGTRDFISSITVGVLVMTSFVFS